MNDNPEQQNGGQGNILPTSDDHHSRADARLVRRAVRNRWPIPTPVRDNLPAVLGSIALNGDDDRSRISAAKALVAMEAQNQADEHLDDKNARLDEGKPTDLIKHELRVEFDE